LIGFDFARIHSIPWGTQFTTTSWALEPQRGVFNWTAFDQQINLLEKYEMDLVGNILYTPQWASSHPEDTNIYIAVPGYAAYAPADMNDFTNFLQELVTRYGDRIKKWEVWNEPHLPGGSIFWHDTPEKFVELLRTGYETIKSIQPDSEIWIGGLGGRRYLPFYNELLRLGGASYFDKLSLHGKFPDPRDFVELDQMFNVASKPWVTSESHAGIVNASGLTVVPTEEEIARIMLLDFMFQMKHQVGQIAYFDMMNLTELEALPFAQKEGWFTHASGLFRKTPRIEPRLGAVVMHRLMETLGINVVYRGEYTLSNNQRAVYFENDGQPLLVVWTDDLNSGSLDSQLAGAFTAQTTVRDWTGGTEIASPTLLLKPNKMYFVRNLDAAFLAGLQSTDNVLLSDYEKVKRSLDIPTANGKQGPLFDHATGALNTDLVWMDQNWRFQSVAGPQPQGFAAKAAVGAAADGLDLVFEVTDAAFIQNETAGNYWRGDSVQFGIDTSGVGLPGGQVEFQAALTASGPVLYKSSVPYIGGDLPSNWTPSNQIVQYGSLSVDRTQADKMVYKIHIDWSELYPYVYNANNPMYLSLLVNANDGNGRIGWLEWSSGIGNAKDTGLYGKIVFDTLAPVTTATVSPAQPDGQNGWYVNHVTVNLESADNLSGVAATYYSVDGGVQLAGTTVVLTTEGEHTLTYWSVDHAGNSEAHHTTTFKIDKTPPSAAITYSSTTSTAQEVVATITPSEAVVITNNGGSSSYTFYYNGSFSFEYVDAAGNHGTSTAVVSNISSQSTAKPGTPILSDDNGYDTGLQDGNYHIAMNMWNGDNGRIYKLYENGLLIETKILVDNAPNAQAITTSINGRMNGTYQYYAELTNAFGTSRSDTHVVTVTQAAPAKPVVSNDNWDGDGSFNVSMNMWWGTNGSVYHLYENGILIYTQVLTNNTPSAQSAIAIIANKAIGTYEYRGELVNYAGATSSDTMIVNVTH
jgi:hypothetical protein